MVTIRTCRGSAAVAVGVESRAAQALAQHTASSNTSARTPTLEPAPLCRLALGILGAAEPRVHVRQHVVAERCNLGIRLQADAFHRRRLRAGEIVCVEPRLGEIQESAAEAGVRFYRSLEM